MNDTAELLAETSRLPRGAEVLVVDDDCDSLELMRMLIAHEAATVVKDMFKTNIDRTRPRSAKKKDAKKPKKGDHTAKEKTSFPSGHSAGAIAAARAFSREYPEHGTAAIGAAVLIAASQVARCAHYPTDVAAGMLMGLAVEGATSVAWNAAEMDQRSVG